MHIDNSTTMPGSPNLGTGTGAAVTLDSAVRGVIYGHISVGGAEIEIFANGILVGVVDMTGEDAPGEQHAFAVRIPPDILLEAPVTVRARFAGGAAIPNCEMHFNSPVEVSAAFGMIDGRVALEQGMLRGALYDVNPDALPITLQAVVGGRIVANFEARKPTRFGPSRVLIAELPFSIALPPEILDGTSVTIFVRAAGSKADLDGSPILISLTHGNSVLSRLSATEDAVTRLTEQTDDLRRSILTDIGKHLQNFILPRVDAIVEIQRTSLERQMIGLWQELTGKAVATSRRKLPALVQIKMTDSFAGYGWSDCGDLAPTQRWLCGRALLAVEIDDQEDMFVKISGEHLVSDAVLNAMSLFANGVKVETFACKREQSGEAWIAVSIVPRSVMRADGILSLEIECPLDGSHPKSTTRDNISLSVGSIDFISASSLYGNDILSDQYCLAGFHDAESTDDGRMFRWLERHGIVLVRLPDSSRACVIGLRGPYVIRQEIGEGLQIRVVGEKADISSVRLGDTGWAADILLPRQSGNGAKLVLITLSASAVQPSAQDRRFLSVAFANAIVSGVDTAED
jgi:hypothetical protein